ncbi:hypothetical protein PR048_015847 [Dryococelus australis]|uniref:Uncharacterized protein n=1 Tax=Dryococelus australis TaxID=614101 RepID=A0ABQ9HI33_9NEOP|nr:hypothetical protein PR048_015847 [Dryococelus australis]
MLNINHRWIQQSMKGWSMIGITPSDAPRSSVALYRVESLLHSILENMCLECQYFQIFAKKWRNFVAILFIQQMRMFNLMILKRNEQ